MKEYPIRLEARNLTVGYGGAAVVCDMNLTVRAGEVLVLLGPNGAGKTTVLKSIAGQLEPLTGTVYLGGKDLSVHSPGERARRLSLLLTERPRGEMMTCREVAAAGRYPYTGRLGVLSREDWHVVDRCMERMGAAELSEHPFESLSDGQRQRVLLARALCQEPEVLVLDEPASHLDIRYQLELVQALRTLASAQDLAVIVSLHELELARRCGDRLICLRDGRVDRIGSPAEVFSGDYLERLFSLPSGSLTEEKPVGFEHYIQSGGKRLRCGYTTGTCAALAASGAARKLLLGRWPETVSLVTPKGVRVSVGLEEMACGDGFARCGVRKDAGDDVDCTAGVLICAEVWCSPEPGVLVRGGAGVGRVTKPGLDQPVGEAAINSTPRRMIAEAVEAVAQTADYAGGLVVTVSVPEGASLAGQTFNPELGIVGGISILGTSGIVEPMSQQALVDTIALELRQRYAQGGRRLILTPGNYGLEYLRRRGLDLLGIPVVRCSNFIGDALDAACGLGFQQILLVGHLGKLVKLAGGIMNTHSRMADCRRELICVQAALAGAPGSLLRELMECATTDACLMLLETAGLREPVMDGLMSAIGSQLRRRVQGKAAVGAVVFSGAYEQMGITPEAEDMLSGWMVGKEQP